MPPGARLHGKIIPGSRGGVLKIPPFLGGSFTKTSQNTTTHAAHVRLLEFARDNDHCYDTLVDACWVASA